MSLHEALERRQYTQAIEILRLGVDPDEPGVGGKLRIVIAARDASADAYDLVYELLPLGADPNSHLRLSRDQKPSMPLVWTSSLTYSPLLWLTDLWLGMRV